MIYTLSNVLAQSKLDNPVVYRFIFTDDKWNNHELMRDVTMRLPRCTHTIRKGFTWDLASIPRIFWGFIAPFGRANFAYLIHDDGYKLVGHLSGAVYTRKEIDDIMLDYAKALMGTKRWSLRNVQIYTCYIAVRAFGWIIWNKNKKRLVR